MEVGGESIVQGQLQLQLYRTFEAILGYRRYHLNKYRGKRRKDEKEEAEKEEEEEKRDRDRDSELWKREGREKLERDKMLISGTHIDWIRMSSV